MQETSESLRQLHVVVVLNTQTSSYLSNVLNVYVQQPKLQDKDYTIDLKSY